MLKWWIWYYSTTTLTVEQRHQVISKHRQTWVWFAACCLLLAAFQWSAWPQTCSLLLPGRWRSWRASALPWLADGDAARRPREDGKRTQEIYQSPACIYRWLISAIAEGLGRATAAAGRNVDFLLKYLEFWIEIFGFCTEDVRFCIENGGFRSAFSMIFCWFSDKKRRFLVENDDFCIKISDSSGRRRPTTRTSRCPPGE